MESLFPLETFLPAGFRYYADFISEADEIQLIRDIEKVPLQTFIFQGYEAKRKVASFGYDWSFTNRRLTKGKSVPESFMPLIEKVAGRLSLSTADIAEVLLTEYPAGSVINWHRDAPPFDLIAGISLHSDSIFRLRPYDKMKQGKNSVLSIPLKRRSLYVISGESRTNWEHSITPVAALRYSVTLRTLKPGVALTT